METALPGEDVLDRSKIAEVIAMERKLQTFTQELVKSTDMNRVDVTTIIKQAVTDSEETESVLKEALRRIAIAEENLAQKGGVA